MDLFVSKETLCLNLNQIFILGNIWTLNSCSWNFCRIHIILTTQIMHSPELLSSSHTHSTQLIGGKLWTCWHVFLSSGSAGDTNSSGRNHWKTDISILGVQNTEPKRYEPSPPDGVISLHKPNLLQVVHDGLNKVTWTGND